MPSLTVENYLKAALQIATESDSDWVATGRLAAALGVSPGTVTSMLKTLDDSGLATYRPYEGACLTPAGRLLALRMLRRHRLIELFLVKTLDLSWDEVHEEAENMEHAVSDVLIDRIDEFLGRPEVDPHGDPIPSADGQMRGSHDTAVPLATCPAGARIVVVRVTNQGRDFLRYLSDVGVEPGNAGHISENNAEAGIVVLDLEGRTVSMGLPAAEQVLVERT